MLNDAVGLQGCGPEILGLLRSAALGIAEKCAERTANHACRGAISTLFQLADDRIHAVRFDKVRPQWLRLYVDTSILLAIIDILGENADFESTVRSLDLALIIAGGVGTHRVQWIQTLIRRAQRVELRTDARPVFPSRETEVKDVNAVPQYAPQGVRELDASTSIRQYSTREYNQPFILRGYLKSKIAPRWPALARWRSAEYLLDRVGEGRVVPVEVGTSYDDDDWGQQIVPFRTFSAIGWL